MKLLKSFIILFSCVFLTIISYCLYSGRSVPFNKDIWNSWDVMFDERRYNMAIWFFAENWFDGKNKEIILDELFQNQKTNHINYFFNKNDDENILLFDLKYSNKFMERNIEFDFMPIAYLKIYFNENNQVIRSELLEGNRRMNVREYKIKKYWKIFD